MSQLKIILLLSYICIASASAAIITPALPYIEQTFHLSHGALEWVISIFLFGYVSGQLIYGPLANRFGRLKALRYGLLINLLGIFICLLSTWVLNYHLLLLGRLITALGTAAGLSCTVTLINELLPEQQVKQAMSFAIVSFTLGIGVAVTAGGLVTQYLHWQDCFWILLIHGVIMLALTGQFKETLTHPRSLHPKAILFSYLSILSNKRFIVSSLVIGLCSTIAYTYSAAAPIFSQTVLKLTPSQYAYWNFISLLGMLGSGFLGAYLVKKYKVEKVLLLNLAMLLPCLISLIFLTVLTQPSVIWFFLTTMFLFLFGGVLFSCGSILASNAIEDKANASGVMSFINMGSAMLSVVVLGYLPVSSIAAFTLTLLGFYILLLILWKIVISSEHQASNNG